MRMFAGSLTKMKNEIRLFLIVSCFVMLCSLIVHGQIAQSGDFRLEQAVIASGGDTSSDGNPSGFTLTGTIGQSVAGSQSTNAPIAVKSGFWTSPPLAPTAASVTVSGRVTTASGQGIRNVRVTLTGSNGEMQSALTSAFGYYRFEDVPVGETYMFSVSAKRYSFAEPTQTHMILEETDGINFMAQPFN